MFLANNMHRLKSNKWSLIHLALSNLHIRAGRILFKIIYQINYNLKKKNHNHYIMEAKLMIKANRQNLHHHLKTNQKKNTISLINNNDSIFETIIEKKLLLKFSKKQV